MRTPRGVSIIKRSYRKHQGEQIPFILSLIPDRGRRLADQLQSHTAAVKLIEVFFFGQGSRRIKGDPVVREYNAQPVSLFSAPERKV